MKLKLENPPDGFEQDAQFRLPVKGEWYLGDSGNQLLKPIKSDKDFAYVSAIVLTPKKPKRFVYKQVQTFEEASKYTPNGLYRLKRNNLTGEIYFSSTDILSNSESWVQIVEEFK